MLTHAARAAAKPFQAPLVAARGAREGLWLEQVLVVRRAHPPTILNRGDSRRMRGSDKVRQRFSETVLFSSLGEKRKLRGARGSGITATTPNRARLFHS